tara:strand:+ start:927 stop:1175 length:249 start_codon:yes stop_codon:yes gene_type:complete
VENERITFNISSSATRNLTIDSDVITFDARFDGKSMSVQFSPEAVINTYARETSEGMAFQSESDAMNNGFHKKTLRKIKPRI